MFCIAVKTSPSDDDLKALKAALKDCTNIEKFITAVCPGSLETCQRDPSSDEVKGFCMDYNDGDGKCRSHKFIQENFYFCAMTTQKPSQTTATGV